jgi:hypothetical protein
VAISYDWPAEGERSLIGKRINRLDGPEKVTGRARYAYDRNITGMLVARLVTSPHAHARITAIDTSAAERSPGFRGVEIINGVGTEVQWQGLEIAAVAADTEDQARDAALAVKVSYEILPHVVKEQDLTKVGDRVSPAADKTKGDPEAAFAAAGAVVHEGFYGLPVITHCCLESHGQVVEWDGDNIIVYASTQAVGRIGADLAKNLSADDRFGSVSPANVRVVTPVMGGGFGIVITMGHIDGPPSEIGHHVGAALVGTFLGILLSYGLMQPVAQAMEQRVTEEAYYCICIKAGLLAVYKGNPPAIAVEFARRVLPHAVRPTFNQTEEFCRGGAPPPAAPPRSPTPNTPT